MGPRGSAAATAPVPVLVVVVATTAAIVRRPAPVPWAVAFTAVSQQPVTGLAVQPLAGHTALAVSHWLLLQSALCHPAAVLGPGGTHCLS